MGKAGRAVCIFTPMALTIASFVCVLLINLGGISKSSSTLNDLHFFTADFTNFTTDSSTLGTVINLAKQEGFISNKYEIFLWNYCDTGNGTSSQDITYCSHRQTGFWFNPYQVWSLEKALNATESVASSLAGSDVDSSILTQLESYVSSNADALYDQVLDSSTRKSIDLYKKLSKWMFAAYFAGLWALVLTLVFGIFAVCSRFGSFLTWICAIISTILIFGGSITATVMFSILVSTLHEKLKDYNVKVSLSTHMLGVTWLATAFILLATLFWLFSCCCCSGKSNPHHRSNKEAPAAELGLAPKAGFLNRGRSVRSEKHGAGYARVESPSARHHRGDSDAVPLTHVNGGAADSYYKQETGYMHEPQSPVWNANAAPRSNGGAYEPFRREH
ncbi:hypothetical protein E4T52_11684 [Aureobasidium sp. EXF-3400]|nr:hypothetical protein E4T51_01036 [Aureobasidium sp. EXF-12344]KAI4773350.1 hypothetical protein E4T52_11684 [Aureobasidium sp. EXF-3400]